MHAPDSAFRRLYAACAAAVPQTVDEQAGDKLNQLAYYREPPELAPQALALVRQWAGLDAMLPPEEPPLGAGDEVVRLRDLVARAADLLDDAGLNEDAGDLRRASVQPTPPRT